MSQSRFDALKPPGGYVEDGKLLVFRKDDLVEWMEEQWIDREERRPDLLKGDGPIISIGTQKVKDSEAVLAALKKVNPERF